MTDEKPKLDCVPCGGTGKVFKAEDIVPGPTAPFFTQPDCPACDGTGKAWALADHIPGPTAPDFVQRHRLAHAALPCIDSESRTIGAPRRTLTSDGPSASVSDRRASRFDIGLILDSKN